MVIDLSRCLLLPTFLQLRVGEALSGVLGRERGFRKAVRTAIEVYLFWTVGFFVVVFNFVICDNSQVT